MDQGATGLQFDLRNCGPASPPAVLLGGLNLVRALGAAGIPVIVAATDPGEPVLASRYCSGRLLLPPLEHRHVAAEALAAAGKRLAEACQARIPLYYSNDDYLDLLLEHRALLEPYFSFIVNDEEVARALIDKQRFDDFARSRGLPVPRALAWADIEARDEPVLVKPTAKIDWDRSPVLLRLFSGAGKARIFATGRELAANSLARSLAGDLLLQEYVPGGDRCLYSYHGYADETGAVLASFVGRKVRTYPALTGMSAFLELTHEPALAELAQDLVRRIPLKGVFKMDFKRHPGDGSFRLLEVNARFNLWHYLAAANGLNLTRVAYDYLVHRRRPAAAGYSCRTRWVWLRADYRAYRELAGRGELGLAGWLWSLLRGPNVYEIFSWRDPLPFVRLALRRLGQIPRLTQRMWRWLFTAS
jgi:predicted ATP-grasp superfamily ATP-dependent carboligase